MDQLLKMKMDIVRNALDDLLAEIEKRASPPPAPAPAPMSAEDLVEVKPTGLNGKGVVHLWPTPRPEITGENLLGYAMRCARSVDPKTGAPYFPANLLGALFLGVPMLPGESFAASLDRWLYPEFWWDAAETERQRAAQDAAKNATWVAVPDATPMFQPSQPPGGIAGQWDGIPNHPNDPWISGSSQQQPVTPPPANPQPADETEVPVDILDEGKGA